MPPRCWALAGGRNHQGKITSRGIGGGVKKMYRLIDFKRRDRHGIEGVGQLAAAPG